MRLTFVSLCLVMSVLPSVAGQAAAATPGPASVTFRGVVPPRPVEPTVPQDPAASDARDLTESLSAEDTPPAEDSVATLPSAPAAAQPLSRYQEARTAMAARRDDVAALRQRFASRARAAAVRRLAARQSVFRPIGHRLVARKRDKTDT